MTANPLSDRVAEVRRRPEPVMNLEQTLEALDWAMRCASSCGYNNRFNPLHSLRESLPQLLADAEAFRGMKEKGPAAYVVKDLKYPGHEELISKVQFHPDGDYSRYLPIPLYALPDTKEDGK